VSEIEYTKIERPVEPYSESENPEQWCDVLAWEEARADELQKQVEELTKAKANNSDALTIAYMSGAEDYKIANRELKKQVEELKEVLGYREVNQALRHAYKEPDSWDWDGDGGLLKVYDAYKKSCAIIEEQEKDGWGNPKDNIQDT